MSHEIQNPLLQQGSLILVTAANGYIASHIVDQLLHYGYAVRGTVRSLTRSSWITAFFEKRHPKARLELVEIPDITVSGCYDAALNGVSAIVHTAANTSVSDDVRMISDATTANLNVLATAAQANKNGESIKRVVLTSSSWAVIYPQPNTPKELTYDTYNETALHALANPNTPKDARGLMIYIASKVESEKESWKWLKEHKDAGFSLNSVLPATTLGPVLAPKEQPYPSSGGFVRSLYEDKNAYMFDWLEPQWYVDVRDAARLHVAAAVLVGVEGERVFSWGEPFTWPQVAEIVEREIGQKVSIVLKDKGQDLTKPPREKSTEYLNRLGRDGWVSLEESVRANIRSVCSKA